MEPADLMKMTMTVAEAREQMNRLPEDRRRNAAQNCSSQLMTLGFTPAQAQAALVLAWNRVLSEAWLRYPDEPKEN